MAQFNENIIIAAPNPIDFKYLSPRILSGRQQPYSGSSEVFNKIPITQRHVGLTVLIDDGVVRGEYWFKDDVQNNNLVLKIDDFDGLGTITGATNVGFFSGTTAVQTLDISTNSGLPVTTHTDYRGLYSSVYNNYYRDENGYIRVGLSPIDPDPKRAYIKSTPPIKSWIWNEKESGGDEKGWYLIDGDVTIQIGQSVNGINYYGTTGAYINKTWTTVPSSGDRNVFVTAVLGNLTTGNTLTAGGPVYARTINNNSTLELRTIRSLTPQTLSVNYDDAFINLSSSITCVITGGTNGIFTSITGNTNVVRLGGDLTQNTIIAGNNHQYSMCLLEVQNFCIDATSTVIDNTNASQPMRYGGDMFQNPINTYSPLSIPDLKTVTGYTQTTPLIKPVNNITVSSYAATINDFYIGASGGTAITLPASTVTPTGLIIVVADVVGNAAINNEVQVNAGAGTSFFGGSSFSLISTAFGSLTYIYNAEKLQWGVLAFNPAAAV